MHRIVIAFVLLLATACGPSKEEIARLQQIREDSIRNAVKEKFEREAALKDSITFAEKFIQSTRHLLVLRNADLAAARDKLSRVKQFQLLRTPEEREQQIRQQTIVIETIENDVLVIAKKIDATDMAIRNYKMALSKLN